MNMRSVVEVTDAAKQHIATILANNTGKHLRVSINDRGCSGHKYQYDLCDWDQRGRFDEVIDWPGGRLVIDSLSVLGLVGSVLDLSQTQFETQLVWQNPMAVNACGCGESFQLASDLRHGS
jgi:iron-sulfur cluster assembly protein